MPLKVPISHRIPLRIQIYTKLHSTPQQAKCTRWITATTTGSTHAKGLYRNTQLVQSTKNWIDRVVIGEKLCPFAPPLIDSNAIRIVASAAQNPDEATKDIRTELDFLLRPGRCLAENAYCDASATTVIPSDISIADEENNVQHLPLHETTLVVFDGNFVRDFHDFVRLSWTFQSEAVVAGGYTTNVQLVLFHPSAKHQTYVTDEMDSSAADYTIRSPYPLIHLLREVDVMRAVSGRYPNLEQLPARNKQKFVAQGFSVCKNRLLDCHSPKAFEAAAPIAKDTPVQEKNDFILFSPNTFCRK